MTLGGKGKGEEHISLSATAIPVIKQQTGNIKQDENLDLLYQIKPLLTKADFDMLASRLEITLKEDMAAIQQVNVQLSHKVEELTKEVASLTLRVDRVIRLSK